jgi:DNA-directed RNA polymerase subunit N (RpoN/RPB10)
MRRRERRRTVDNIELSLLNGCPIPAIKDTATRRQRDRWRQFKQRLERPTVQRHVLDELPLDKSANSRGGCSVKPLGHDRVVLSITGQVQFNPHLNAVIHL